jgi:hypothetical protein
MCGLETAAGHGAPGKLEGVTGARPTAMWKGRWCGEQEKVLSYVKKDVVTTMQVYQES